MKKWITGLAVVIFGLIQLLSIQNVSANSLDDIRQQQEQKQEEIDSLQKDVAKILEETSELNGEIEVLNLDISQNEQAITDKEAEIVVQEEEVKARLEQAGLRLQALQKSEINNNMILTLLEAESLTDLFNRALVVLQLTDAGNQQIEEAHVEVEKLAEMKEELLAEQEKLETNLADVSDRKAEFDEKVTSLQTLVKNNQAELTQLQTREAEEEALIEEAREAARAEAVKEAEERSEEEQLVTTSSSTNSTEVAAAEPESQPDTSSNNEKNKQEQPKETQTSNDNSNEGGRTIQVIATGYSTQQANLGKITATGIDLTVNPRVIAVDPSVIPLGATVEIPGKGIFIAGDTGGAIKGNKIDIHFSTVSEALQWGRKNITIRILN